MPTRKGKTIIELRSNDDTIILPSSFDPPLTCPRIVPFHPQYRLVPSSSSSSGSMVPCDGFVHETQPGYVSPPFYGGDVVQPEEVLVENIVNVSTAHHDGSMGKQPLKVPVKQSVDVSVASPGGPMEMQRRKVPFKQIINVSTTRHDGFMGMQPLKLPVQQLINISMARHDSISMARHDSSMGMQPLNVPVKRCINVTMARRDGSTGIQPLKVSLKQFIDGPMARRDSSTGMQPLKVPLKQFINVTMARRDGSTGMQPLKVPLKQFINASTAPHASLAGMQSLEAPIQQFINNAMVPSNVVSGKHLPQVPAKQTLKASTIPPDCSIGIQTPKGRPVSRSVLLTAPPRTVNPASAAVQSMTNLLRLDGSFDQASKGTIQVAVGDPTVQPKKRHDVPVIGSGKKRRPNNESSASLHSATAQFKKILDDARVRSKITSMLVNEPVRREVGSSKSPPNVSIKASKSTTSVSIKGHKVRSMQPLPFEFREDSCCGRHGNDDDALMAGGDCGVAWNVASQVPFVLRTVRLGRDAVTVAPPATFRLPKLTRFQFSQRQAKDVVGSAIRVDNTAERRESHSSTSSLPTDEKSMDEKTAAVILYGFSSRGERGRSEGGGGGDEHSSLETLAEVACSLHRQNVPGDTTSYANVMSRQMMLDESSTPISFLSLYADHLWSYASAKEEFASMKEESLEIANDCKTKVIQNVKKHRDEIDGSFEFSERREIVGKPENASSADVKPPSTDRPGSGGVGELER